jgi:hypothetical protein
MSFQSLGFLQNCMKVLKKSAPEKEVLSNIWWFTAFITEG